MRLKNHDCDMVVSLNHNAFYLQTGALTGLILDLCRGACRKHNRRSCQLCRGSMHADGKRAQEAT